MLLLLVLAVASAHAAGPLNRMFPSIDENAYRACALFDCGKPVTSAEVLRRGGDPRKDFEVTGLGMEESYAGYLTVNESADSNMFFWFFPAQEPKEGEERLLLWLQGGPGGSSLFGLFVENGPYHVTASLEIVENPHTWNKHYSMLYFDNPVGTGYSYTSESGYCEDEVCVGEDLYRAMQEFYRIFPEHQGSDFYITGESYAGKYVPALGYTIHEKNAQIRSNLRGGGDVIVPLKGMAIGDGWVDPPEMVQAYPDIIYYFGLSDQKQREVIEAYVTNITNAIADNDTYAAFLYWDAFLNGDLTPGAPYFQKITGLKDYYNILRDESPVSFGYYPKYVQSPTVRKAIHVGNHSYGGGTTVEKHLAADVMRTIKPWMEVLMDHYDVMIYNGMLDVIIGAPLTERYLRKMRWSGQEDYLKADRIIWQTAKKDVAGYVRSVKNFRQVNVRNAGHILPFDQPEVALDMITRFVERKPFN